MGAWSNDSFGNDDAADWLATLKASAGLAPIEAAIGGVFVDETAADAESETLDAAGCSRALAAAEVVAALLGKPAASLPDDARAWAQGKSTPRAELVDAAREAVQAIIESSELQQLQEESDDYAGWRAANEDLLARLS